MALWWLKEMSGSPGLQHSTESSGCGRMTLQEILLAISPSLCHWCVTGKDEKLAFPHYIGLSAMRRCLTDCRTAGAAVLGQSKGLPA